MADIAGNMMAGGSLTHSAASAAETLATNESDQPIPTAHSMLLSSRRGDRICGLNAC
jgi:hypothetical protein